MKLIFPCLIQTGLAFIKVIMMMTNAFLYSSSVLTSEAVVFLRKASAST